MDRQILNFTANEQALTVDEPIKISTNKVNYIQANFDLGQNWQGYDSIRAIWWNDFQTISTVLDSQGVTSVPFEVMKRKGCVKVNLVGSISEDDVLTDRLTSYPVVAVIVDCTAQITGANTSPITPSEYEQFVAAVHEDADRAEQSATDAQGYASDAQGYAQDASTSAQSAHDDKIAIEQAIAEVVQQIEDFEQVQVVVNTLPPSSQATSDFTDGVLTLGIPQGVKGDTGNGIQSIAKVSTSGLVDTYRITYTNGQTTTFTVTNGAKGDTGNGIQSIAKTSTVGLVDTYTITYTNGTTTTFTVTNGEKGDKGDQGEVSLSELEQATVVQTLSDSTPYNHRRTNNGNGSGTREYDEIVGASVGWNQLIEKITSASTQKGITVSATSDNGAVSFSGTATSDGWVDIRTSSVKSGHLYYICATTTLVNELFVSGIASNTVALPIGNGDIKRAVSDGTFKLIKWVANGDTYNSTYKPQLFDLTLMLGSTIADYVYSLEQSTAGSGVTWLKTHFPRLFDNGYQPFDSGSIKSVSGLTAHEMVGRNLFKTTATSKTQNGVTWTVNEDGTISVSGTATGYTDLTAGLAFVNSGLGVVHISGLDDSTNISWGNVLLRDGNNQTIHTITSGSTSRSFDIDLSAYPTANNITIQFKRQNNTATSGTLKPRIEIGSDVSDYTEYEKHTYPLDSSVTLRGKYVLDNGVLKAVGDVYPSSGQIGRTWGEVDLGSLNWNDQSIEGKYSYYSDIITDAKRPSTATGTPNCVCGIYAITNSSDFVFNKPNMSLTISKSGRINVINNSYSTVNAFKTAMNGVKLVYELATPTTEQATPYDSPQWCDANGTEEYVGSELPVGHNTDYPMTMVDCADGLGDGTYEAKLTIANGVKTFTWQSV